MSINALEVVSLQLAKLQCMIDGDDLDELITEYIYSALDYCLNQVDDPNIDTADKVPNQIKQAMRLLIAEWLKNREATTNGQTQEIPNGVKALLMQCRNWYGEPLPEA